jgi:hypothetical protein
VTEYTYNKVCNLNKLTTEISALPNFSYITGTPSSTTCYFITALSSENQLVLDGIIDAHTTTYAYEIVEAAIAQAIKFGNDCTIKFATENVLLGITQANMTNTVRRVLSQVLGALSTGSLYDAIYEIRQIPAEDKDEVFITDARLLTYINDIEDYLGIERSTQL